MNNYDILINELSRLLSSAKEEKAKLVGEKEKLSDDNYKITSKVEDIEKEITKLESIIDILQNYNKKLLPARLITIISMIPSIFASYFLLTNNMVFNEPISTTTGLIASFGLICTNVIISKLLYNSHDLGGRYTEVKKDNDIASSKDQLSLLNEEKLGLMREKEENDEQIAILDEEIAKVNEEVKSYDKKIDLVASKKMMALSLLSLDEEVEAKLDQKFMNDNGIEVILKRER